MVAQNFVRNHGIEEMKIAFIWEVCLRAWYEEKLHSIHIELLKQDNLMISTNG
jgi:hypothetical protein